MFKQDLKIWSDAVEAFNQKKYSESLEILKNLIRRDATETSRIAYDVGMCHYSLSNYKAACDGFSRAIKHDQYFAVGYYMLAICQYKLGIFGEAYRNFSTCLEQFNKHDFIDYTHLRLTYKLYRSELLFNMGICLYKQGKDGSTHISEAQRCKDIHDEHKKQLQEQGDKLLLGNTEGVDILFVDSTKIFTPPKVNINALADGAKKVQEIREKRSNSAGESKLPRDVARLAEKKERPASFQTSPIRPEELQPEASKPQSSTVATTPREVKPQTPPATAATVKEVSKPQTSPASTVKEVAKPQTPPATLKDVSSSKNSSSSPQLLPASSNSPQLQRSRAPPPPVSTSSTPLFIPPRTVPPSAVSNSSPNLLASPRQTEAVLEPPAPRKSSVPMPPTTTSPKTTLSVEQAAQNRKTARLSKTLPSAPSPSTTQFVDTLPPRKGPQIPKIRFKCCFRDKRFVQIPKSKPTLQDLSKQIEIKFGAKNFVIKYQAPNGNWKEIKSQQDLEQLINDLVSVIHLEEKQTSQWSECFTAEGQKYYYNSSTGESSWEIPSAKEWTECFTEEGYVYYYNTKTGKSVWEKPT